MSDKPIIIQITNVKSKLLNVPSAVAVILSKAFEVPYPNFWFSQKYKQGLWDGKMRFFQRPANTIATGLVPKVIKILKENECDFVIQDLREDAGDYKLEPVPEDYSINTVKESRNYQIDTINKVIQSNLMGIPFTRGVINVATNGGKAQPLYTKVLTSKGFITMKEVQPGMQVIGDDGKPHTVLRVFNHDLKHIYRVTLNDGTYTDCCNEHLWTVQNDGDRTSNQYRTLTLEELSKTLYYGIKDPRPNWTIPVVSPVEFEENPIEIDPWLLGFLLGDGDLRHHSIAFSTSEADILEKVTELVESYGDKVKHYSSSNYRDYDILGGNLLQILRKMKVLGARSYEKHIPQNYLINTYENRLQLLRGLLDADGYVSLEKSGYVEYSTTSQCLSEQVKFLVYSMGGSVNITEKMGCYTKEGIKITTRLQYNMGLRFFNKSVIPVSSQKHVSKWVPRKKGCYKYIVDVTYLGDMPAKCIFIDNPSSLYVTDDFIVTHNTTIAEALIKEMLPVLEATRKQFLFITHSKEIAYQAKKSIETDLGISVGMIGDGKWEVETVSVALVPTLYKRIKKPEFKDLVDNVKGFVLDECHHSTSTTWFDTVSLLTNAVVRLGLTGTVDKENKINEYRLYSCTGSILSKITNEFLIEEGYSAKPVCILFENTSPELEDSDYQEAYQLGVIESSERNDMILDICIKETESNNKVLILVERIDHGEILLDLLEPLEKKVVFTSGQLNSEERQDILDRLRKGKIDILISTSILDEGVDVSNINALIYARGMKATRKLLQGIGRGLRKKSDNSKLRFYDFVDNTHTSLLKHSLKRATVLKNENFTLKKMEIEDYNKTNLEEL